MHDDRRSAQRWQRAVLAMVALTALAGCRGSDTGADPVGAAGYSSVIDDFLPPLPSDDSRPVVYVARLSEDPFPLEDQVAMIAAVEENHDLRFVDDIAAAIDDDDSDAPPRNDGLLLGIGTISATPPHIVRVEVYSAADLVEAYKVTLTVRGDVWRVETSEPVDPEALLGDE